MATCTSSTPSGRAVRVELDRYLAALRDLEVVGAALGGTLGSGRGAAGGGGADGRWHGRVTMGTRLDGRPVSRKTKAELDQAVRALERAREVVVQVAFEGGVVGLGRGRSTLGVRGRECWGQGGEDLGSGLLR